jgi:hypothetical protein
VSVRAWLICGCTTAVAGLAIGLFVLARRGPTPHAAASGDVRAQSVVAVATDAVVEHRSERDAVAAPPRLAAELAARAERETVLANLRESGSASESWEGQASALFQTFARDVVHVSDDRCFVAGCGATLTFPSEAAMRRAFDDLQTSEAYRKWTGGKRITAPEHLDDGRVVVALVLYRPD